MIRIFINALGASAGAGLTYLHNVVPQLSERAEVHTLLAVQPELRRNFEDVAGVELVSPPQKLSAARRFLFEQCQLPGIIRRMNADVLISAGNFALRKSPVPQILLSGNSLYTSHEFARDLKRRRAYRMLAGNFIRSVLAKKSVHWADRSVAPSQAFAEDLSAWTGKDVAMVYHGFDHSKFCRAGKQLQPDVEQQLGVAKGCLRLLFVSHYNYYRNFETLLRALPLIQRRLQQRRVRLILTCRLKAGAKFGGYDASSAAQLLAELGIESSVIQLGPVPYESLHALYRACDLYVTAAYAETFAHPLVEAMASGLPVVASNLRVHREVCRNAALYFDTFSPRSLAEQVVAVANSPDLQSKLTSYGTERCLDFSWAAHVEQILEIAKELRRFKASMACAPLDLPVASLS